MLVGNTAMSRLELINGNQNTQISADLNPDLHFLIQ